MTEYLPICKEQCNKQITKEEILTDTVKCNWCDVPYIIIEEGED